MSPFTSRTASSPALFSFAGCSDQGRRLSSRSSEPIHPCGPRASSISFPHSSGAFRIIPNPWSAGIPPRWAYCGAASISDGLPVKPSADGPLPAGHRAVPRRTPRQRVPVRGRSVARPAPTSPRRAAGAGVPLRGLRPRRAGRHRRRQVRRQLRRQPGGAGQADRRRLRPGGVARRAWSSATSRRWAA